MDEISPCVRNDNKGLGCSHSTLSLLDDVQAFYHTGTPKAGAVCAVVSFCRSRPDASKGEQVIWLGRTFDTG